MAVLDRIQPTLSLFDQGLSLYRQHFVSFVLISALWLVPVAGIVGIGMAFSSQIEGGLAVLLVLVALVVLLVLMVMLVVALSRAATAAIRGEPIRLGALISIAPLRVVGMTMFTVVYFVVAQILSSIASLVLICPMYLFGVVLFAGMAGFGGGAGGVSGLLVLILVLVLVYSASMFLAGAVYSGMVYGLQPWAQEQASFGVSLQRSIDLMVYRFWRNLGVWGLAAVILAAVGLSVSSSLGTTVLLIFSQTLDTENPIVQAVIVSAWLVGLILILPPLPIWMAMLYHNNWHAREGSDLQQRVDAWWQRHVETNTPNPAILPNPLQP